MEKKVFDSAADRIAYSEAVDFLEQGRLQLVPHHLVELYVNKGLWSRDGGDRIVLTDEGRRQHDIAVRERFSDG
jgi:hypothetical protein